MGNHQSKNQGSSSQTQSDPTNTGFSTNHSSSLRPHPSDQILGPPDRSRDRPRGLNAIVRGTVSSRSDPSSPEARKETKAEKDARRLEKERAARAREREVSTREENVDGGYLVTLGTYIGTEDWDKMVVRRLMV